MSSFVCKACGQFFAEYFSTFYIPALRGMVCEECYYQIHESIEELSKTGRFTMEDEDGNIYGIVLGKMDK
jgi:hypothetical protein